MNTCHNQTQSKLTAPYAELPSSIILETVHFFDEIPVNRQGQKLLDKIYWCPVRYVLQQSQTPSYLATPRSQAICEESASSTDS